MDALAHFLQPLDLHPVADHFTVALLMVGVLIDLIASLFPLRAWLRYMALTLMVLGALSAGSSYATGDMEADRIWNALTEPAKAVLHRHAFLAQIAAGKKPTTGTDCAMSTTGMRIRSHCPPRAADIPYMMEKISAAMYAASIR